MKNICGPDRNSYSKTDLQQHSCGSRRITWAMTGFFQLTMFSPYLDEYIAVADVNPYRSDMDCFVPLLERFHKTYGFYPKYPVADAGYGSYNNYIYCE